QQTLRATIDWSDDLLSEPERVLLRRLSVFAGGWTLEAAEAICGDEEWKNGSVEEWKGSVGPPASTRPLLRSSTPPEDVLDLLTRLVDQSLVVYEEQEGKARYRLLETVRQYYGERLLASREGEGI